MITLTFADAYSKVLIQAGGRLHQQWLQWGIQMRHGRRVARVTDS